MFWHRPWRPESIRGAQRALRILIATDAWTPQVNGVVRTLKEVSAQLGHMGHAVRFVTPEGQLSVPLPTYPEIRLALFPRKTVREAFEEFHPDAIHIATEGPIGFAARKVALERGYPFTTSFHTRFPDYVKARLRFIPESLVYRVLKAFHRPASATMVPTLSLKRELEAQGFANLRLWSRGVDVEAFKPGRHNTFDDLARPVFLYVGRVAVEKNIEAFLAADLPGTKVVIGDGPARGELEARYPGAKFLGQREGAQLASFYGASDVFVFPSRTDTFGLVMLEALACGVPVAAYPAQAPLELIGTSGAGVLDNDLSKAAMAALAIPRDRARAFAREHSWRRAAEQFLSNVAVWATYSDNRAPAIQPAL